MDEKKKVYVETSVISNLTARPSHDIFPLATVNLLDAAAVPHTSYEDAVHIATAAVSGMDYLVTWNCRHPQVTWSPNLNTNGIERSYTIWGKFTVGS